MNNKKFKDVGSQHDPEKCVICQEPIPYDTLVCSNCRDENRKLQRDVVDGLDYVM